MTSVPVAKHTAYHSYLSIPDVTNMVKVETIGAIFSIQLACKNVIAKHDMNAKSDSWGKAVEQSAVAEAARSHSFD